MTFPNSTTYPNATTFPGSTAGPVLAVLPFDPGGDRGQTEGQPVLSGSFDGETDPW